MTSIAEIRKQFPQYADMGDSELAGAIHKKFYSDMQRADFDKKIGLQSGPGQSSTTGIIDQFTDGLTMGLGPKITAVEAGVLGRTPEGGWFDYSKSFGDRYNDALQAERSQNDQFQNEQPVTAMGANIAGSLLSIGKGASLAKAAAPKLVQQAGKTLARRAATGAGVGAGIGATQAFGDDESIASGATIGAVAGSGGQIAGEAIGRAVGKFAGAFTRKAKPSYLQNAEKAAETAYRQADEAGVIFRPEAMKGIRTEVVGELTEMGYDPALQPGMKTVLDRLDDAAQGNITFKGVDVLRRVAGNVARDGNPSEQAMAMSVINRIDDLIENPTAANVLTGDPVRAAGAIKRGREAWKKKKRLDAFFAAVNKSKNQATGFENGLVIQMRQIANNPKRLRQFDPEQQQLIKEIVRRGSLHGVLRGLGMLSPNSTFGGIAIGGTMAGTGIAPGLALAGTGYASRKGAEAITRNKGAQLERLIATGSRDAAPRNTAERVLNDQSVKDLLGRMIMAGGLSANN